MFLRIFTFFRPRSIFLLHSYTVKGKKLTAVDFIFYTEIMMTREEKKAQTRQAILDAAVHLFSKKGFEKTSIDELAKKAGIGKGTIYSYFKTKTDIIRAFCSDELEFIHQELARKTNPEAPFLEQIHTIFYAEFKYISKNPDFGRTLMKELVFPRETHIKCVGEENDYFAMLFPIIEKAQEKGELKADLVPLHVAGHFYAIFLLLVSSWYGGRVAFEEVHDAMHFLFQQNMDGLAPIL